MSRRKKKAQPVDFDKSFGEIRSLLATEELTQEHADKLWQQLFALSTSDKARFFETIEPHVRQSNFFERPFTVPMYQGDQPLEESYDTLHTDVRWGTDYYSDSFSRTLIYGRELDAKEVALQGATLPHEAILWVPDPAEFPDYKGRVLLGVDPQPILSDDLSRAEKASQCEEALNDMLRAHFPNLSSASETRSKLYLILEGRSVECTLSIGPLEEIEGSEGKWLSDLKKGKLDVVRENDRYEQDWQNNGPAYRCAAIKTFRGSGVHEINILAIIEGDAIQRLQNATLQPTRQYVFTCHMEAP